MQIRFDDKKSSLLDVYVQDFGDNYHKFGDEPSTELERAVRRISRRYKDIYDYNRAMVHYTEYMSLLMDKYGGPHLFELKLKAGLVDEFMPPRPGIKMNELNKLVHKSGILISKRTTKELDSMILTEYLDAHENQEAASSGEPILYQEPDLSKAEWKEIKSDIKSGSYKGESKNNRVRLPKNIPGTAFLDEYMRVRHSNMAAAKEREPEYSLTDYYTGDFANGVRDTTEEENDTVYFRGHFLNRESADELAIYKALGEAGWDSMKVMRGANVSKSIAKVMKEDTKDGKKKKKKRRDTDALVANVLGDGGYGSFEEFMADMQDMRSDNVMKG